MYLLNDSVIIGGGGLLLIIIVIVLLLLVIISYCIVGKQKVRSGCPVKSGPGQREEGSLRAGHPKCIVWWKLREGTRILTPVPSLAKSPHPAPWVQKARTTPQAAAARGVSFLFSFSWESWNGTHSCSIDVRALNTQQLPGIF